jgi:hypothetical protein
VESGDVNLAAKAQSLEPRTGQSPWDDYEYGRGYAVLTLPFDSGHLLGLRVFPENNFAPYVSVWHRSPDGDWEIYVDGPFLETACPRYWEPATQTVDFASIDVRWTGANDLRVEMDEPKLEWTLTMGAPPLLRVLNTVNSRLPLWTWKLPVLLRLREWIARHYLDYGDIALSFTTASGHDAVLLARENYVVHSSTARLDGDDLGELVHLDENPTVGEVPLPTAPSFVFGQAHARIVDQTEFQQTMEMVRER